MVYVMKEVTVLAKNEIGALETIASALGASGINIETIAAYAKGPNEAVFRIVTTDPATAKKILSRVPHVKNVEESEIIVVKMPNRPGELAKITKKLAKNGVDLESVYILSKEKEYTEVAFKPIDEHFSKAKEILGL
ncbi:MAG: ACT domain-containing protein [Candidatus Anstonellales archaeon]